MDIVFSRRKIKRFYFSDSLGRLSLHFVGFVNANDVGKPLKRVGREAIAAIYKSLSNRRGDGDSLWTPRFISQNFLRIRRLHIVLFYDSISKIIGLTFTRGIALFKL